jgi:hypothetical protein
VFVRASISASVSLGRIRGTPRVFRPARRGLLAKFLVGQNPPDGELDGFVSHGRFGFQRIALMMMPP